MPYKTRQILSILNDIPAASSKLVKEETNAAYYMVKPVLMVMEELWHFTTSVQDMFTGTTTTGIDAVNSIGVVDEFALSLMKSCLNPLCWNSETFHFNHLLPRWKWSTTKGTKSPIWVWNRRKNWARWRRSHGQDRNQWAVSESTQIEKNKLNMQTWPNWYKQSVRRTINAVRASTNIGSKTNRKTNSKTDSKNRSKNKVMLNRNIMTSAYFSIGEEEGNRDSGYWRWQFGKISCLRRWSNCSCSSKVYDNRIRSTVNGAFGKIWILLLWTRAILDVERRRGDWEQCNW